MFSFFKKKKEEIRPPEVVILNESALLHVSFMFTNKPRLDRADIVQSFKRRFEEVEGSDLFFAFPEYMNQFTDATIPAQALISDVDKRMDITKLEKAIQQCWDWQEAAETIEQCRFSFGVTEFLSRGMDYKFRVEYFQKIIDCLIELTQPQAIHFHHSDKIVQPNDYLEREDAVLMGLMNIRLFNISDGEKETVLMDTVGLHAFGLADWQLIGTPCEVDIIAGLLTNYGYYNFEEGNVIEDGNTIQGVETTDKWRCSFEDALIEPERGVFNIVWE